ncbi:leucine-rich repeat-domain-containing protein [Polychytrium aggregatum]|uniref:leucine-rich repeat-domain-containing protein n=1 Tax=Polychytrium aggregatum TaxID=110093 RepID=UPI0022FEAAF1|nr:leucine-rich repeat-domain-containing protein [Polychytrium aggregatum]KAI9197220.1 leucine-rich repeat-domain-containing protein [Polychytrium aggregatum]
MSNKLNYDLLSAASSFLNAVKDRELDLRAYKISKIENLSITKDQNDTIDLSDNDLRKIENIPYMTRLKSLFLSNNRISRIDLDVPKNLPNVHTLILTNNQLQELGDLDPLADFAHLETLSLIDNPVALKKYYRLYLIHKCKALRILDFQRIKDVERAEARRVFGGADGSRLLNSISTKSTFEPGQLEKKDLKAYQGPTPEEAQKIRESIKNASTLDEINRLERLLRGGVVPESNMDVDEEQEQEA